ncbi:MAG: tRNA guanosine(34) transglycosylase Tgt [Planctomycetaceae bacterium]|nr:tRNA guanosine(34) transglycosylase Tgt [Planctomycetaceae bacterium]
MSRSRFRFDLLRAENSEALGHRARLGRLTTPHGVVQTPAFMPVGTQATVKGLTIDQVHSTGAEILLGNTYHLALRPGSELIAALGGLHQFMGWTGPILTDSGGFQLFSLAQNSKVTDEGAVFRSHIDGSLMQLTPEDAVRIQEELGSDIAMVLDHVIGLPSPPEKIRDAVARTIRWADRCRAAARRPEQTLFAITQGGLDCDLRLACTEKLVALDFAGYAIGGLSVGEPPEEMYRVLDATVPALPAERPRYLMGVGRPQDLVEGIARGIDMFDCVMPTRNARNALAFTRQGPVRLRNLKHARDPRPLEEDCPCPACRHSRAYLRHLFLAREMLGPTLLTLHNLTYYQRLMAAARAAIAAGEFETWRQAQHRDWAGSARDPTDSTADDTASGPESSDS